MRPGFDTGFLGFELPLPAVMGVAEEFRYLHFSVVMNAARRLPWYVAYNLAPREAPVERADDWQPDPLLPATYQAGNQHFLGPGLHRGHMVAPLSVSWGSRRQAWIANHQAFFWTNAVPQHALMNERWWWSVEQWERDSVAGRACRGSAFAGPMLSSDDPVHSASEHTIGRLRVRDNFRLPRHFWKIVVLQGEGVPEVSAYWFDQEALLANRPNAVTAQTFRTSIDLLQARTGLSFDELIASTSANRAVV